MLNEIELVYKEYLRCLDYTQNKSSINYSKMQFFDPEKWRKKFKLLFDREKIIDFGQPIFMTMSFNQESDELLPKTNLGREVLASGKFWLLFLAFCKINRLDKRVEVT